MNNFKVVTFQDDEKKLEVIVSEDTKEYWFTIDQLCLLFSKSKKTIYRYIAITYDKYPDDKCHRCVILTHELSELAKKRAKCYSLEFVIKLAEELGSNQIDKILIHLNNNKLEDNRLNDSIVYNNGVVSVNVKISPQEDTVWLTQSQIATLFDASQQNVSYHINNIYNDDELKPDSVHKEILYTASDNKQYIYDFYNLDMILAIGYRIKSKRAIEFRKWATNVLSQYLIKGYCIDSNRVSVTMENVLRLENDVAKIKEDLREIKSKINAPKEMLFNNGQYYDAFEYLSNIMRQANNCIDIVDPYFDRKSLIYLKELRDNVNKKIYFNNVDKISNQEIQMLKKQYSPITFYKINMIHDRFIIIDNEICYAVGTSLNHAGRQVFSVCKIETTYFRDTLINILKDTKEIYQN